MENVLKARITADVTGLQQGLSQAEKNLQRANAIFEKSSKSVFQLENSIAKLGTQYKNGTISEKQFTKEVEILNRKLQEQRDNVRVTSQEINRLNGVLKSNNTRVTTESLGKLSNSTKGLTTNVKGANNVAIEFNRIVQDAPFGIIGVGNNIQQLAANFSNLQKTTGSTTAALKAGFSALITGPNLALLAISALTAGITAYQMGAFDGLSATKNFKEELEKFRETLKGVDSVRIDSLKNSDQEIVTINSLKSIIEDETNSREVRNKAIDTLQKEYPKYFANLSREKILAGEVGEAYKAVTAQLIARAEVESAVSKIVELNDRERVILEQNKNSLNEINALREKIAPFQEKLNKAELDFVNAKTKGEKELAAFRIRGAENQIRFFAFQNQALNELLKIESERDKLLEVTNNALKQTVLETEEIKDKSIENNESVKETGKNLKLNEETLGIIANLTKRISDLNAQREGATDQEEINLLTGKIDLLKQELSLVEAIARRANTPVQTPIQGLQGRDGFVQTQIPVIGSISSQSNELEKLQNILAQSTISMDMFFMAVKNGSAESFQNLEQFARALVAFENGLTRLVENAPSELLGNLFLSIGNAIGTGANVFQEAGKAVLGSFAQFLGQFGKLLIQYGTAGFAYSKITKALLNPLTAGPAALAAIAAGGTLLAISGAIRGALSQSGGNTSNSIAQTAQTFSNQPSRREFGGSVVKGRPYIVGEKRPELFVPNTNGTIIPRLPDVGSANNSRMSQGIRVEVIGTLSGDTIRLANKRAESKVRNN